MGNTADLIHEFNCVLNNVSCSIGGLRSALDAFAVVASKIEHRISELESTEHSIALQAAELNNREEQLKVKELEWLRKERIAGKNKTRVNNSSKSADIINLNVGMYK